MSAVIFDIRAILPVSETVVTSHSTVATFGGAERTKQEYNAFICPHPIPNFGHFDYFADFLSLQLTSNVSNVLPIFHQQITILFEKVFEKDVFVL